MDTVRNPSLTVATVVMKDGRFLLVEEHTDEGLRLNQPAGHWEPGERLIEAAARETLEESACLVQPTAWLGIYQWTPPDGRKTYFRVAFVADLLEHLPDQPLDDGIVRVVWMTAEELEAARERWRSPLVGACVRDYLTGVRLPLSSLKDVAE